eukprot:1186094-Prorocentrum_minimum.AAC.2
MFHTSRTFRFGAPRPLVSARPGESLQTLVARERGVTHVQWQIPKGDPKAIPSSYILQRPSLQSLSTRQLLWFPPCAQILALPHGLSVPSRVGGGERASSEKRAAECVGGVSP